MEKEKKEKFKKFSKNFKNDVAFIRHDLRNFSTNFIRVCVVLRSRVPIVSTVTNQSAMDS
jgi:hypothetical protein